MLLCRMRGVILLFLYFQYSAGNVSSKVEVDTRIVGGAEIDVKNRNFQVSIQYAGQHFCGGALITPDTILTAAHCFGVSYSSLSVFYQVRIGSNSTTGTQGQVIQIKSVFVHPNFSTEKIDSDICLVKLRGNVTISSTVGFIRISENENYSTGSSATVSGWGYQSENGTLSPYLRYASVPISLRTKCETAYRSLINITRNMICAGYQEGGKDACQGDSGGPLVQNNQLIGVVSFGMGCARKEYPGVYTNVARLLDWVVANSNYIKSVNGSSPEYNNDGRKHGPSTVVITVVAMIFCLAGLHFRF